MNIFPVFLCQFVDQKCVSRRFSACFTSFSGRGDTNSSLYESSTKSQETSLTRRESRSLLSSFSPSLKRASYGRSAETKSKMVCSFVLEMHIYTPVMNNYSVLILRLRSLRYGLFVWFPQVSFLFPLPHDVSQSPVCYGCICA